MTSPVTDLVSRLLEAIAEVERDGHRAFTMVPAAYTCPFCARPIGNLLQQGGELRRVVVLPCGHAFVEDDIGLVLRKVPAPGHAALRRCAADRRRLERHTPCEPGIGYFGSSRFKDPDTRICAHCSHDGDWGATVFPCPDFVDLADSYGIEVTE